MRIPSVTVGAFAQQLKGGKFTGAFDMAATARLACMSKVRDGLGLRAEFVQRVELAHSLQASTQATISPTARID
ncbi:YfbK domain-containing protein [Pseudomonas sp. MS19]|uniref:YfbK domain-containing protein n=1 Tax=Pseudomonas sp. MS19 TaxID=2579939 RepID=UPI001F5B25CC|nr:YfbK domain-containing protein [Pseudomonas sp. MS19]